EIAGKRAHVSAFAAAGLEDRRVLRRLNEIECVHRYVAGGQSWGIAAARQIIGAFTIDLKGRKGGRHLGDRPGEPRTQRGNRGNRWALAGLGHGRTLAVVGAGFNPPAHCETVGLFSLLNVRHGFRRLAKCYRQNPSGDGIECARVSRLLGIEQPLEPRHRMRRCHALWFIEDEPAMNAVSLSGAGNHSCSSLSRSKSRLTWGSSSNSLIFISYSKRRSA